MKKAASVSIFAYSALALALGYVFHYLGLVDVSLIYCWQQEVPASLGVSLTSPGGLTSLLADLSVELTTKVILGKIIIMIPLLLSFISASLIFRREKQQPLFYSLLTAAFIPFVLSLSHYRFPFELITSLSIGLLMGMIFSKFHFENRVLKIAAYIVIPIITYMLSGIPGLLILSQVMVIELVWRRRYLDLLFLIPALSLPYIYMQFDLAMNFKQAYLGNLIVSKYDELPHVFYFCLISPFLLYLAFSLHNIPFLRTKVSNTFTLASLSLTIVLAALVYFAQNNIDDDEKNGYSIVDASFKRDWDKVLELTGEPSSFNKLVQFEVNRALCAKGLLLEEMFSYPQKYGENGIFLDGINSSQIAIHTAEFYYDLGYANETRHWATEAQMLLVRHPVVLKQLVMSYIAIGQKKTATKYLGVLQESRLYHDWANRILAEIEYNTIGEDPDIKFFRENDPDFDFFAGTEDPVKKIRYFFYGNRSNKMAFDLLIAGNLLKHNVGAVLTQLPEFKKQGYENFPRAVEEALLIYIVRSKNFNPDQMDYSISKSTVDRFNEFNKLMASGKTKAEKKALVSEYRNTYWYYILFSSPYASKT